ncbi:MAG: cbb3-type cytochrome c oxidase subunit II [Chthoniobacterales bacterium]
MKGLTGLVLGVFGTFAFSWLGLTVIPSMQIGHLDPQMDEEGNDPYPAPKSGLAERGRKVYVANGCVYCHSQQVRPEYAASDIERKWGTRRSAPRDYIFERPALLGKMRMGPDLANVGKRAPSDDANAPAPGSTAVTAAAPGAAPAAPPVGGAPPPAAAPAAVAPGGSPAAAAQAPASGTPLTPGTPSAADAPNPGGTGTAPLPPGAGPGASPAAAVAANTADSASGPTTVTGASNEPLQYSAAWHHRHLYDPRSVTWHSNMPSFKFLYEKRRITGQPAADALKMGGAAAKPDGWEIVPTPDANALVAYLMSLDQSHELKEVKSSTPASPPAPGKAVK